MKSYFVSFCILASLTLGTTMRPALAHPPYEPLPDCTCNCFCKTHGSLMLTYPQIFACTADCHASPFIAELDDMVLNAIWAGLIGTQAPSLAAKSIKADTNKAVGKTIQRGDATTVASDSPMFGEKKEKWAQEHYSAETKQTLDQWRKELSSQDAAVQQQNAQK